MEGKLKEFCAEEGFMYADFGEKKGLVSLAVYNQHCQNCRRDAEECEFCPAHNDLDAKYYMLTHGRLDENLIECCEKDPVKALRLFCGAVADYSDEFKQELEDLVLTEDEKRRRKEESDFLLSSVETFKRNHCSDSTRDKHLLKVMDEAKCERHRLIKMILTYQNGRKWSQEELDKKTLKRLQEIYDVEVKHFK